jgi:teichuronic acid biosynthesis glycosyltransferase TuaC
MRILFVSSGTSKNGIGTLVLNQGESLKRKGIRIQYFTINSKGFLGYFYHILKLRRLLNRDSFDLIHAHYGFSGFVAMLAKPKNQKLLISFMGTDLLGYRTRRGRVSVIGSLLIKINQKLAAQADFIIVKSNEMSQKIKSNNKAVTANGVNMEEFYPVDKADAIGKLGWNKDNKHIFFMGDPERPEKNFILAKSALKKMEQKNIELHVLKNICPEDILYYYNASDVCLLTSFYEGSPNVIKEAMACNCPVVSTDVGDVKDLMGSMRGYYITSFDINDVASKIRDALLFSNQDKRTNGRERLIEVGLDSKNVANRIIEIYRTIAG